MVINFKAMKDIYNKIHSFVFGLKGYTYTEKVLMNQELSGYASEAYNLGEIQGTKNGGNVAINSIDKFFKQ